MCNMLMYVFIRDLNGILYVNRSVVSHAQSMFPQRFSGVFLILKCALFHTVFVEGEGKCLQEFDTDAIRISKYKRLVGLAYGSLSIRRSMYFQLLILLSFEWRLSVYNVDLTKRQGWTFARAKPVFPTKRFKPGFNRAILGKTG